MAAARKKRGAPPPVVELTGRGLTPLTAADAEILAAYRPGQAFDLVPHWRKRSNDQQRLYWAVLNALVAATGAYPDAATLHELVVIEAGYVLPVLDPFTCEWRAVRQSTAFDEMEQDQFNAFVTAAFAKLSEAFGVDVLDLLPDRGGAPGAAKGAA